MGPLVDADVCQLGAREPHLCVEEQFGAAGGLQRAGSGATARSGSQYSNART